MVRSLEFRSELRMFRQRLHHQRMLATQHREHGLFFDREMREKM